MLRLVYIAVNFSVAFAVVMNVKACDLTFTIMTMTTTMSLYLLQGDVTHSAERYTVSIATTLQPCCLLLLSQRLLCSVMNKRPVRRRILLSDFTLLLVYYIFVI